MYFSMKSSKEKIQHKIETGVVETVGGENVCRKAVMVMKIGMV